ncbi:MAG: hypothetical protein EOP42_24645 [Sphingobacteriaceae bacterium]|nr:MAG: hypothetical protein EOP42_24645 [Sphingobacteriaceae bacterium]
MNKFVIFILVLCFATSCSKKEVTKEPLQDQVFNDPNWIQLKIPNAGEVNAVAGSINDTLLVTTRTKALFTSDKGVTWQESKNFNGPTPGLLAVKDTIYALIASASDAKYEKTYASLSQYYTLNTGLSWNNSAYQNLHKSMQTGIVTAKDGSTFKLNYHTGSDKSGKGNNYVLQTTISKTDQLGNTQSFTYPIKRQPLNLFLDKQDRLYIATSGGYFTDAGVLFGPSMFDPAYIYISKNAISQ